MSEIQDFLEGGSTAPRLINTEVPVGTVRGGIVSSPPVLRQQTDYTTGDPKTWSDGSPMMQLVIPLLADGAADEAGPRTVYVHGSAKPESRSLKAALLGALQGAGLSVLAEGDDLRVKYLGLSGRAGQWEMRVTRPVAPVAAPAGGDGEPPF